MFWLVVCFIIQVKFHIISHHKLHSYSSKPNFSSVHYLNIEQSKKCLTFLYALYEENRNSNSIYKNEPEFYSFHVLLHLSSNSQPLVDICFHCLFEFIFFSICCSLVLVFECVTLSVLKRESLSLWLGLVPFVILKSKEKCFAQRFL